MQSAVTVSLVPQARGGPFVFWDGLEDACVHAAALGFAAVEIFPSDAAGIEIRWLKMLLEHHGLAAAAIGTGAGWIVNQWTLTHPDATIRFRAKEFIQDIIEVAAVVGAPAIIGSMQGRCQGDVTREQALDWLGAAISELAEYAAHLGASLLFEPLNRYESNLFNRLDQTVAWLNALPTKNVRILADLFHMNIEETDMAAAIAKAGSLIGHVHFADSNRCAVGMGHTAIGPVIDALRAVGYNGYLSAEVLPFPDSETAARRTIESFRRFVR